MKSLTLFTFILFGCGIPQFTHASSIQNKLKSAVGDSEAVVSDYDAYLKKVVVDSKVYFATHDGRYLFAGPVFDTTRQTEIVALSENEFRRSYLSNLPDSTFVRYPSHGPEKYRISVFTDIDCPYCRKLHNHMAAFNAAGISVDYILVPRTGKGSQSHSKTVAALCAETPAEFVTSAMRNEELAMISCDTGLVETHSKIGKDMRINATPTIVLPNGGIKPGLIDAKQLIRLLKGGVS